MKKRTKKTPKKEEIAEDWCFVCKDGGLLLVCDYKQCLKAYHPHCVDKDDSFLETDNHWACGLHSCLICSKSSYYHCYSCPKAVCQRCIKEAEFVHVRGKKGFCSHCLKLALLVEENKDVDSDGGKVDFKDRETYEGLFREYWEIINEKEGLTLENLESANDKMKKGMNYKSSSDSDKHDEGEEDEGVSDFDGIDEIEESKPKYKRKRSKCQPSARKGRSISNKKEFIGWGSRSLIQFLESIGRSVDKELSQRDVTAIINDYIKENKLFHPEKKRLVVCDASLQSVFRRKTVNKHKIYDFLDAHFAENEEPSEEDETGYNSEDKNDDFLVSCKRDRNSSKDRTFQKEVVYDVPQICYASIIPVNISLVYLRRSLVQKLLEQPDMFESKVIGSFVKIKSDPNDLFEKNQHQLLQVTGTRRSSFGGNSADILLQVSGSLKDISISLLSDSDVCEEECAVLRHKMKCGLLKKPTLAELEQKARSLHEDITKHWIDREIASLQNRIDRANEKGWRRELFEYMERRQLLQTSAEQSRLLQKVPSVVPDVSELELIPNDIKDDKSTERCSSDSHQKWEGNKNTPVTIEEGNHDQVSIAEGTKRLTEKSAKEEGEPPLKSHILAPGVQQNVISPREKCQPNLEERSNSSKPSNVEEVPQRSHNISSEDQSNTIFQSGTHQSSSCIASKKKIQPNDVELGTAEVQQKLAVQLVDFSSGDKDGNSKSSAATGNQELEDPENCVWHCVDSHGKKSGPLALSFLKRWRDISPFASKFKVWKTGQTEENAVSLNAALALLPKENGN